VRGNGLKEPPLTIGCMGDDNRLEGGIDAIKDEDRRRCVGVGFIHSAVSRVVER